MPARGTEMQANRVPRTLLRLRKEASANLRTAVVRVNKTLGLAGQADLALPPIDAADGWLTLEQLRSLLEAVEQHGDNPTKESLVAGHF